MSFNSTVVGPSGGYLAQVHDYFYSLTATQLAVLLLVNIPVISIALNVLSQLVRVPSGYADIFTSSRAYVRRCLGISRFLRSYSTGSPGSDRLLRMARIL